MPRSIGWASALLSSKGIATACRPVQFFEPTGPCCSSSGGVSHKSRVRPQFSASWKPAARRPLASRICSACLGVTLTTVHRNKRPGWIEFASTAPFEDRQFRTIGRELIRCRSWRQPDWTACSPKLRPRDEGGEYPPVLNMHSLEALMFQRNRCRGLLLVVSQFCPM